MTSAPGTPSAPIIGITMGDPGGVGPEIICKALASPEVRRICRPLVIGSVGIMQRSAQQFALQLSFSPAESISEAAGVLRTSGADSIELPVFAPPALPPDNQYTIGEISAANGQASHACIVAAARAALGGEINAICTAPIAKEALFQAGFSVPGHTELLASLCNAPAVRMMLVGGGLNVVLQTIHVALADVPGLLSQEGILESLRILQDFATKAGISQPRIAVCGLNPHAGEGGHFGSEEQVIIAPALEEARAAGMDVAGPLPADTVFHRTVQREFDFVLAMYHDQGLIPVKTLDFHGGVNVTLGLPIIRTSPDHGTAFGIAGRGIAYEGSITAAIRYAALVAARSSSPS